MSEQLRPGWSEKIEAKPQRCFRDSSAEALQKSRLRGARRGAASRYALKNLPPIEEEDE